MAFQLHELINTIAKGIKSTVPNWFGLRQPETPEQNFQAPTPTPDPWIEKGYTQAGGGYYKELDGDYSWAFVDKHKIPQETLIDIGAVEPTAIPTLAPTEAPKPVFRITPKQEATVIPQPTPTPVQQWYRNPAIARGEKNTKAFKLEVNNAKDAIEKAAQKYGVPVNLMMDIAFKESSLDANAQPYWYKKDEKGKIVERSTTKPEGEGWLYSSAGGLFQFTNATWDHAKKALGSNIDRYNPYDAAMAAAHFIKNGYLSKWDASRVMVDPNTGVDYGWGQFYTDDELAPFYR